MLPNIQSNFEMLSVYEPQLWRLNALAERYFALADRIETLSTAVRTQTLRLPLLMLDKAFRALGGAAIEQRSSASELEMLLHTPNERSPRPSPRNCKVKEILHA